jgi:hypothetical protein
MTNLEQSLTILDYFSWAIINKAYVIFNKSLESYAKEGKLCDDEYHHVLVHLSIINICSFLDEYHNYLGVKTEDEYKEKVLAVKDMCKPFVNGIKRWPGFNSNRNLLAHTFRDKNGVFAYHDPDHEKKYVTPNGGLDWMFIHNCIVGIKNILNLEFKEELPQAVKELEKLDYRAKNEPVMNGREIENEFFKIVAESAKISHTYGKWYNLNITKFFIENEPAVHFGAMDSSNCNL